MRIQKFAANCGIFYFKFLFLDASHGIYEMEKIEFYYSFLKNTIQTHFSSMITKFDMTKKKKFSS